MPVKMTIQSEAEQYFSARATRRTQAKALLERIGTKGRVRDEDRQDMPEN